MKFQWNQREDIEEWLQSVPFTTERLICGGTLPQDTQKIHRHIEIDGPFLIKLQREQF